MDEYGKHITKLQILDYIMQLRDYQKDLSKQGAEILRSLGIVYLAFECRVGKTLTSLELCKIYGAKKVLFTTKVKAIKSIEEDYKKAGYTFDLVISSKQSIHKVLENDFDVLISDEHHFSCGSFPKPSTLAKELKKRFGNIPMIFVSATPTPESFSQIFHQYWISNHSPFKHKNFYQWAKEFVNVKQKHLGFKVMNDYSDAKQELIKPILEPYTLTFTQEQAGFVNKINEHFIPVKMKQITYQICNELLKNKLFKGNTTTILADTGAKLQSKLHQLYSGTIKFEEGNSCIVDASKAIKIKQMFEGNKIAIFYKFIAEKEMLVDTFGDLVTDSIDEFNTTNKSIIGQIQSIREGVKLDKAEAIVYLNIDFSALSYWQGRDRMTTLDRKTSDIYWVFADGGIEAKIYKSVLNKKNYTLATFKKDFVY